MSTKIHFSSRGREANTYSFSRRSLSRTVLQIVGLLLVLLIERVVGLPIFFCGMYIQAMDQVSGRVQYLFTFVAAVLIGIAYQVSFVTTFITVITGMVAWVVFTQFGSSKTARVLVSSAAAVLVLVLFSSMELSFRVIFYGLISSALLTVTARLTGTRAKSDKRIFDL